MPPPRVSGALLSALALGACAADPPDAPGDPRAGPMRVIVRLAQPLVGSAAITAAAEAAGGRPARLLAPNGSDWYTLSIDCTDAADCSATLERLRADAAHFSAVRLDGRKRIVSPTY